MMAKGACEMDKSGNRKGITIKINGQEKSFEELESDRPLLPENQIAATAEKTDEESFDWILPEEDEYSVKEINTAASNNKGKKAAIYMFGGKKKSKAGKDSNVFKMPFIAILCAILIGTCLGFIILKTITASDRNAVQKQSAPTTASPAEKSTAPAEKTEKTIPSPMNAYLVQGGVFSTEDSAKQMQKSIKQKGIPAEVFQLDGKFYIFSGTAGSLEDSKALASFFKQGQLAFFWKEISFAPVIKEGEKEYVKQFSSLYSSLSQITSRLLYGPDLQVDQKQLDQQLKDAGKIAKVKTSEPLEEMEKQLSAAAELLGDFQTSKDQDKLLSAQEQLLAFLKNYQSMESQ
ncbi:SPOR domain-containing protein [Peribacillus glennii]|nr:SPOR domain-containing protein [Peribacillus glennii]